MCGNHKQLKIADNSEFDVRGKVMSFTRSHRQRSCMMTESLGRKQLLDACQSHLVPFLLSKDKVLNKRPRLLGMATNDELTYV